MTITFVVDARKETLHGDLEVTLYADGDRRYDAYVQLRAALHPDVRDLKIGDRLTVTIEKAAHVEARERPVSDVERTIEDAERLGLAPASFV